MYNELFGLSDIFELVKGQECEQMWELSPRIVPVTQGLYS